MNYEKSKTTIKFVYEHEGLSGNSFTFPETKIEHTIDGESTLDECLEAFENFLLGCGYRLFDGGKVGITEE